MHIKIQQSEYKRVNTDLITLQSSMKSIKKNQPVRGRMIAEPANSS